MAHFVLFIIFLIKNTLFQEITVTCVIDMWLFRPCCRHLCTLSLNSTQPCMVGRGDTRIAQLPFEAQEVLLPNVAEYCWAEPRSP